MIKGIKSGVDLINDVSGFEYDKEPLKHLKKYKITKAIKSRPAVKTFNF